MALAELASFLDVFEILCARGQRRSFVAVLFVGTRHGEFEGSRNDRKKEKHRGGAGGGRGGGHAFTLLFVQYRSYVGGGLSHEY